MEESYFNRTTERKKTGNWLMSSMFSVSDKLDRTIYDAQNTENLPGNLVRREGGKAKGEKTLLKHMNIQAQHITFSRISLSEIQLTLVE